MKVFLLFFLAIIRASVGNDVVLTLKYGKLQGKVVRGVEKPYEAFLGVPYAQPPVDWLRFRSPVPCEPWSGVYDATYARSECLQKIYHTTHPYIKGEEDCLYLNIYRPHQRNPHEKLPVIVYFSFGGFETGHTHPENVAPDYFMATEKVIVVVVQNRLGVFGYLSSGDPSCSGNFGLKDQALALQWVNENIGAFQGDYNSVTVMGAGAGAITTQIHWLHPKTSRLFHRVILKSGDLSAPFALLDCPRDQFIHHAKTIGIEYPQFLTSLELTEKLRKADAKLLLAAYDSQQYQVHEMLPYRVVVETKCEESYVTENPQVAWRYGHFDPKPLYVTFTPSEGNVRSALLLNENNRKIFNRDLDRNLAYLLSIDPKYLKQVKEFYFNDENCEITDETVFTYINMITMRNFHYPLYNTLKWFVHHVNTQKYPLSIDEFAFNGPEHFTEFFSGYKVNLNTGFSDDLLYLFRFPTNFPEFSAQSISYQLKNIYVDSHVNFALTGMATTWTELYPCDDGYFHKYGFCEYQIYMNQSEWIKGTLHDQITVDNTHNFNFEQINFWNSVTG